MSNIDNTELAMLEKLGITFGKELYAKYVFDGDDLAGFELPDGCTFENFQKRLRFQVLVAAAQHIIEVAEQLVEMEREDRTADEQIEFNRRKAAMASDTKYEPASDASTTDEKEKKTWN